MMLICLSFSQPFAWRDLLFISFYSNWRRDISAGMVSFSPESLTHLLLIIFSYTTDE